MMKLLIISVTYNMPQNRVSDTITHVTLNDINGVAHSMCNYGIDTDFYFEGWACVKHTINI
jgi:hypothetical protein